MRINQIIRSLRWFLAPTLIFGLLALFFTARNGLAETQIWFNQYYSNFLDLAMPWYTYLGDGLVFLMLIVPFLFLKRRAMLALIFSAVLTLLFTSALKSYFNDIKKIDVNGNVFTDAVGNNNSASSFFDWTFDTVSPTMTITASEGVDGFTSNDSTLSLTFTSSESTTNFASGVMLNFKALGDEVFLFALVIATLIKRSISLSNAATQGERTHGHFSPCAPLYVLVPYLIYSNCAAKHPLPAHYLDPSTNYGNRSCATWVDPFRPRLHAHDA